ncbi:MAG: DNA topoisomerase I [Candidatus Helarchaeota archaeon]
MASVSKKLIICEKPTACEKISKILDDAGKPKKLKENKVTFYQAKRKGEDLIIVSGIGHLFTVERKDEENKWKYPFWDTKWKATHLTNKKMKHIKNFIDFIEKLSKNCNLFINACDYDLEGSTIGYNILKYCCPPNSAESAKRMKFSTLTQKGIIDAYDNLLPTLNFNLVEAGLTRHEVDFIYGINLSTALVSAVKQSDILKFYLLSIGRVQGPTLSFIEEKNRKIQSFVPKPYWTIDGKAKIGRKKFDIEYESKRILYKKEAEQIINDCKNKDGEVKDIKTREMTRNPPAPFNLSSLQTDSYNFFGYTPSQTLKISERLYLSAYISYPRTSNTIIPPDVDVKSILTQLGKQSNFVNLANKVLSKKQLVPTQGKKKDPAHPPILPTGEVPTKLSNVEQRLYELIVRRFFAIFADPAKIQSIKTELAVNGYKFYLRGRQILKEGWLEFYPYSKTKEILLPNLKIGEKIPLSININEKFDSPPSRFNPNSLRKLMEKNEIGTKATRANIIDILYQRGYIWGKSIEITDIGQEVIRTLKKYCPDIISVSLTRELERKMDEIEQAKRNREDLLLSLRSTLGPILEKFKEKEEEIGKILAESALATLKAKRIVGKCMKCGTGDLTIIRSKASKKRFIGCSNYPNCQNSFPISQKGSITPLRDKYCKYCEEEFGVKYPMIQIRLPGKRPFNGCINWVNHPKKPLKPKKQESTKKMENESERGTKESTISKEKKKTEIKKSKVKKKSKKVSKTKKGIKKAKKKK